MLEVLYCQQQQHIDNKEQEEESATLLAYDLTTIRDTICFLTTAKNWLQQSDALCSAYHFYYSMASKKTRSFICIGVSCLFVIAYAGWVILLQQQHIHLSSLTWLALVMIMCAHSPWVQPIQTACVRAMLPLISYCCYHYCHAMARHTTAPESTSSHHEQQQEVHKRYRFELYHHQRWWFPTGWSNLLLPQDRAVWTDAHLETTPSTNNFCLPPKTTTTLIDTHQQKIVSWTWVDPEWSRYQDATTTDKNGWEYGNWHWKQWTFQSIGLGICTRRQKWYRDAQRTECLVQLPIYHPQQEEQEVMHWDNQSITTNHSSSGSGSSSVSGIMTPVDPIIVSFDNKGERMLRRRSSNLSNKSVTFNDTLQVCSSNSPSADDLYNKYCKSPKPQILKRFSI
ncbi:hypothetical protein MBANPS3_009938 [Mucor bainieri]